MWHYNGRHVSKSSNNEQIDLDSAALNIDNWVEHFQLERIEPNFILSNCLLAFIMLFSDNYSYSIWPAILASPQAEEFLKLHSSSGGANTKLQKLVLSFQTKELRQNFKRQITTWGTTVFEN